jgi:hypothetical protein
MDIGRNKVNENDCDTNCPWPISDDPICKVLCGARSLSDPRTRVEDQDSIIDSSGYCSVHKSYHCECYRPNKQEEQSE